MRGFVCRAMDHQSLTKIIVGFSISFLYILPIYSSYAEKRRMLQTEEVLVLFDEPLRSASEEALDLYPGVKQRLERALRCKVDFRPTVMLVRESKTFQRLAGSSLIVAFADPQRNLIVIDYSKMKGDPFTLETTLKHELCHLLLHRSIRSENLPRWLDEGVCQWASDGMAEVMMKGRGSILDKAVLTGKVLSIKALGRGFPQDKESLSLAYEESKSFLEYIIDDFGEDRLLDVLNGLRKGEPVDTALLKGLSMSLDELERRWQEHLKKEITWLTYLINHLYEVLFFLAALIMIYGFVRVWRKKRAYGDIEDDGY